ncbi:MarR family transcriptional regulator [Aliidongia dinghuensis]|uniref:MarR family transcriptional regulator n=1 Tax=Aliidongia dinghuensis TaxID=1867774 RepID=A0A8J3E5B3_9PROT|nr:MarR family transcriptional regulator [Aliidongia dinghuensis]GGF30901.1 MarR family transcriptional regulator [Aliidongia dinghuensis]
MAKPRTIGDEDYQTLAAFRYALRRFLAFSERAAKAQGLTAQQHQALLAMKGYGQDRPLAIGDLAEYLMLRHNSAVELVDRLVQAELVERLHAEGDRRRVTLALTPKAEAILQDLSTAHLEELRDSRTLLAQLLERLGG